MTPEEKELHEFFKSILGEKAKEKFDRLIEIKMGADESPVNQSNIDAFINDACLWFRHDFGLLSESEKNDMRLTAVQWHLAFSKAFAKIQSGINT
jgi:hypothetical protein